MAHFRLDPQTAAEKAVSVIGQGYNLANDLMLSSCKAGPGGSRLVELDQAGLTRDLLFPSSGGRSGSIVVAGVPNEIKCYKGEVIRSGSEVLSSNQMSEKFNQEMGLSGKTPSAMFNAMFDFRGCWQKDAGSVKSLGFDGWFVSLYNIVLERSHIRLSEQVMREVPPSWDPVALAKFIEKYGTHVVVGVKMGGKDVMHVKQLQNSNLKPPEVQKILKRLADERFSKHSDPVGITGQQKDEHLMPSNLHGVSMSSSVITTLKNEDVTSVAVRRGGVDIGQAHNEWLPTISESPDVLPLHFFSTTWRRRKRTLKPCHKSLPSFQVQQLSHSPECRRYSGMELIFEDHILDKPPIEELHQFLEFQLPRLWAPTHGDLPLTLTRRKQASPTLRFSLMGPKLYVNTAKACDRLYYLEGKRRDHLAIHLQHLSYLPPSIQLSDNCSYEPVDEPIGRGYLEPVNWSILSHVCTAPVEHNGTHVDDTASIVTRAWFEVNTISMKKVLFLRLGFSIAASMKIRRSEWDEHPTMSSKWEFLTTSISTSFSPLPQCQGSQDENSAKYPSVWPLQEEPKMSSFVETREMVRGGEEPPGYWVVTGAKLCVERGKISFKVNLFIVSSHVRRLHDVYMRRSTS